MGDLRTVLDKRHGLWRGAGAVAGRPVPTTGLGAAVLCYHDVGTDPHNHTDYYLSPERFRRQLEAILGWGLRCVSLGEIVDRLGNGDDLDGLVAVTFDDALAGVLHHALPVLRDLAVPATVFVVSGVQGIAPPFWPGAARTLDGAELRELAAAGVTIGSHTRTHPPLPDIDPETAAAELRDSRAELEEVAGTSVDLLAYPYGHHAPDVAAATSAAGYRAACTFTFGRVTPRTDRFAIPRFCMSPRHHRARLAYHLARPPSAW